jgi:hypothetical protein
MQAVPDTELITDAVFDQWEGEIERALAAEGSMQLHAIAALGRALANVQPVAADRDCAKCGAKNPGRCSRCHWCWTCGHKPGCGR